LIRKRCLLLRRLAQSISISGVVKGLGLSSALEAFGLLVIPTLPADLPTLGC
jgi:hypothetical protein